MIATYLITCLIILALLGGWLAVQHMGRVFARRHPEFGPAREEGGSCMFCLCGRNGQCPKRRGEAQAHVHHGNELPDNL